MLRMAPLIDLHMHTTFSDGKLSVEKLFQLVSSRKVGIMALTDHDTVKGVMHALKTGVPHDFTFIPGVEISTGTETEQEVHITGYFPKTTDFESLQKDMDSTLKVLRYEREKKMVQNLNDYGFAVEWSRVLELANGANPSRPLIADVMVEKGYIKDRNEAFAKYIGNDCPCYYAGQKLSPKEGIELIHKYGGVASWAHPWYCVDPERLLVDLVSYGLDGMESFPPFFHEEHNSERYVGLFKKYGLIATSGSDFHDLVADQKHCLPGENTYPEEHASAALQLFRDRNIL